MLDVDDGLQLLFRSGGIESPCGETHLVEEDISGHEHRVVEQAHAHVLALTTTTTMQHRLDPNMKGRLNSLLDPLLLLDRQVGGGVDTQRSVDSSYLLAAPCP